jgi:hypoxanthine phosphoribosyltransferase
MERDIKQIMLSEEVIRTRVKELGAQITKDYKNKDLILVGVLKGANVFMSDLMRTVEMPIEIDFISVSSYGSSTESSGVVRILKDLDTLIEGKDVIIVEDIVDSGLTLNYLKSNFESRRPNSIKICSLLDKPERRKAEITIDYMGFSIPDEFIVGYGIDYAEGYRNLPYIASLREAVYSG